jgi:hypothetical protein
MLPASYAPYVAITLALGGLLSCFAGYKLFRLVLGIFGFYIGAMMTGQLMDLSAHHWALLLAALVGGLIGAGLMLAAYFVGVGLVGAGLAALAINALWGYVAGTDPPTVILIVGCVLGALGALSIVRYVVVFGTALAGAWTMIISALAVRGDVAAMKAASAGDVWILYPLDPATRRWWLVPLWLGLSLAGIIVQLSTTKGGGGKRKPARAKKRKKNEQD